MTVSTCLPSMKIFGKSYTGDLKKKEKKKVNIYMRVPLFKKVLIKSINIFFL